MASQCSRVVYLNQAASTWPKAPGVAEATQLGINAPPYHPGRASTPHLNVMDECRERLAGMMRVSDHNRIILCNGATQALNIAILGLELRRGARVISSVTEHNSLLRPLNHLVERQGISVAYIGLNERREIDIDSFQNALKTQPQLVAINHVSNVTGRINDVTTLFALAKAAGAVTLLDASQSLGHIPVHPAELNADIVAFTGHKGLRGPSGTGGLYVASHIELEPVMVGGTGVRSDLELQPPDMPMRLEAGTPNVPAFAGLAAALHWHVENGDSFNSNAIAPANELRERLKSIDSVDIYDVDDIPDRIGIVSFRVHGWEVEEVGYVLEESFGIVCRTGLHCAPLIHKAIGSMPEGTIRFSLSGSNTIEDVRAATDAVERLAA